MVADDEGAANFIANVIDRDGLWRCYSSDTSGNPFTTFDEFCREVNNEFGDHAITGGRPRAFAIGGAAGNPPLCEMTTAERYAARRASSR
jgi:hypothetical protein